MDFTGCAVTVGEYFDCMDASDAMDECSMDMPGACTDLFACMMP